MTSHYAQANKTCKSFGILQNVNNAPNYSNGDQTEQKCRGFLQIKQSWPLTCNNLKPRGRFLKIILTKLLKTSKIFGQKIILILFLKSLIVYFMLNYLYTNLTQLTFQFIFF